MENWKVIQRSTAKTTHTIRKKFLTWILQEYYGYEMIFFFSFEQEILVPKDFEAGGSRMIIGAGTFNKVKAQITGKKILQYICVQNWTIGWELWYLVRFILSHWSINTNIFFGILCISLIIRIFDKNKHSFVKIFLVFFPKPYLTEFTGYVNSIVVEMFADCVSCDINYQ